MSKDKPLYTLEKIDVFFFMIAEMVLFLLPAILAAVMFALGFYVDYGTGPDKPAWILSAVFWPFIPFALCAPFVCVYRKLWRTPHDFFTIAKISFVPFIPGWVYILGCAVWLSIKWKWEMVGILILPSIILSPIILLACYLIVLLGLHCSREIAEK